MQEARLGSVRVRKRGGDAGGGKAKTAPAERGLAIQRMALRVQYAAKVTAPVRETLSGASGGCDVRLAIPSSGTLLPRGYRELKQT